MIIIKDTGYPTADSIDELCSIMKETIYKEEDEVIYDMFHKFLIECFNADQKLQQMIIDKLGEDFFCFVLIPMELYDNLDSFSFQLGAEDGVEIKKRDEIIFQDLCNICFGNIEPFYLRLLRFYDKP